MIRLPGHFATTTDGTFSSKSEVDSHTSSARDSVSSLLTHFHQHLLPRKNELYPYYKFIIYHFSPLLLCYILKQYTSDVFKDVLCSMLVYEYCKIKYIFRSLPGFILNILYYHICSLPIFHFLICNNKELPCTVSLDLPYTIYFKYLLSSKLL